jgi:arylsulfatase B
MGTAKRLALVSVFSVLSCWLSAAIPAAAQQDVRPNIIYILADDLGWADVGFHGSDIKTPNIDDLAQTGARLEQFYVQPMCTPRRAQR